MEIKTVQFNNTTGIKACFYSGNEGSIKAIEKITGEEVVEGWFENSLRVGNIHLIKNYWFLKWPDSSKTNYFLVNEETFKKYYKEIEPLLEMPDIILNEKELETLKRDLKIRANAKVNAEKEVSDKLLEKFDFDFADEMRIIIKLEKGDKNDS